MFFSGRSHLLNQQHLGEGEVVQEDPVEDFRRWVADPVDGLDLLVHHYRTFRKFGSLHNITLLHYANMKRDLPAALKTRWDCTMRECANSYPTKRSPGFSLAVSAAI